MRNMCANATSDRFMILYLYLDLYVREWFKSHAQAKGHLSRQHQQVRIDEESCSLFERPTLTINNIFFGDAFKNWRKRYEATVSKCNLLPICTVGLGILQRSFSET